LLVARHLRLLLQSLVADARLHLGFKTLSVSTRSGLYR
jgi:hypothetical protein